LAAYAIENIVFYFYVYYNFFYELQQIEAAINSIEFSLRENNTGRFPRGLSLMLRSVTSWLYDRDPFRPLRWEADLASFKQRLASGEDVFGPLIDKYLVKNTHRVTVELRPDSALGAKTDQEEKAKLDGKRASMSPKGERAGRKDSSIFASVSLFYPPPPPRYRHPDRHPHSSSHVVFALLHYTTTDLEALVAETHALKERQETPDAPEALQCIPGLKLSDIPAKASSIPTVRKKIGKSYNEEHLFPST
jgi:presequence protease